jgi:hypothetical protein
MTSETLIDAPHNQIVEKPSSHTGRRPRLIDINPHSMTEPTVPATRRPRKATPWRAFDPARHRADLDQGRRRHAIHIHLTCRL